MAFPKQVVMGGMNLRRRILIGLLCSGALLSAATRPLRVNGQTVSTAPPDAPVPPDNPTLSQRPPAPTLTITTREILLDIVVTDANGHPIQGLKPTDFTVTEENSPQQIRKVEEHTAMQAADLARGNRQPPLPPNTFTNYTPTANTNASTVILLDALDTRVEAQMYLREQLIDYLKHMKPGAPIAIFQLDMQMKLIQGFSSDPAVLLAAAESKRDLPSMNKPIHGSPEFNLMSKNAILHAGLEDMGRYLAGFPGRKNLIWFTGQIPMTWWGGDSAAGSMERAGGNPFHDDFSVIGEDLTQLADELTLSRVAVYPIDARGLQTLPQFDASRSGRARPESGMRFDSRQAFDHMDLESVADATGGKAYFNTNGLKEAIAEIVESGSNYYMLSYATNNTKWEGQYRRIKVTVDRPDAKLQYRRGYYAVNRDQQEQRQLARLARRQANAANKRQTPGAQTQPNPDQQNAATAPDSAGATIPKPKGGFDAAMQLGAIPPTEIVFTAHLMESTQVTRLDKSAPLPKDNYLTAEYRGRPFRTFKVQVEADPHPLRLTQTPDGVRHGEMQFVAVVYDQTGVQVNSLQQKMTFVLDEEHYRMLLKSAVPATMEIAVPVKGNFFLRVGVHDLASDRAGAVEIPVDQIHPEVAANGLLKP